MVQFSFSSMATIDDYLGKVGVFTLTRKKNLVHMYAGKYYIGCGSMVESCQMFHQFAHDMNQRMYEGKIQEGGKLKLGALVESVPFGSADIRGDSQYNSMCQNMRDKLMAKMTKESGSEYVKAKVYPVGDHFFAPEYMEGDEVLVTSSQEVQKVLQKEQKDERVLGALAENASKLAPTATEQILKDREAQRAGPKVETPLEEGRNVLQDSIRKLNGTVTDISQRLQEQSKKNHETLLMYAKLASPLPGKRGEERTLDTDNSPPPEKRVEHSRLTEFLKTAQRFQSYGDNLGGFDPHDFVNRGMGELYHSPGGSTTSSSQRTYGQIILGQR